MAVAPGLPDLLVELYFHVSRTPSLAGECIDEPVHDRAGVLAGLIVLFGARNVQRGLAHGAQHCQRGRLDRLGRERPVDNTREQGAHQADFVAVGTTPS